MKSSRNAYWIFRAWWPLALILLTGCGGYYYAPSVQNVPLFKEKGEADVNLSLLVGRSHYGLELQGAYAPVKHLGVFGNFMMAGLPLDSLDEDSGSSDDKLARGLLGELGTGYFTPLGKKFVFETYVGGGYGRARNRTPDELCTSATAFRYFIQPVIGYRTDLFDLAFSARLCGVKFTTLYGNEEFQDEADDIGFISSHRQSYMLEPALTLRYGKSFIMFQAQSVWSINLSNPDLPQDYFSISMGVVFRIPPKGVKITPVEIDE